MRNVVEDIESSYLSKDDIDLIIRNFKEAKVEMLVSMLKDDKSDMSDILEDVPDDEMIKVMLDDVVIEINKPAKKTRKIRKTKAA